MPRRRNSALRVVELFRGLSGELVLNDLVVFMYICENEGLNVTELAQVCKITEATASRRSRALAEASMPGAISPAIGLVEAFQGEDGRQRLLYLTKKGRDLRNLMADIIAEASPLVGYAEDELWVKAG